MTATTERERPLGPDTRTSGDAESGVRELGRWAGMPGAGIHEH